MQLENHKLIRSGVVNVTGLLSLSTCSAYEMYRKEMQQSISNCTKKTQQIKETRGGGEESKQHTRSRESSNAILGPKEK